MTKGFSAYLPSIDGSAHLLIEIAGLLYAGRLDGDTSTMARAPRAHQEVGAAVEQFARFADDQYRDLVLLLTALSTRLKATGISYVEVDEQQQAALDAVLSTGLLVAPADR
jgi:hypothetical protein